MAFAPSFTVVDIACSMKHGWLNDSIISWNQPRISRQRGIFTRKKRPNLGRIAATSQDIDFTDPDWKSRFESEFESRFSLPHLRDVIDISPRWSTFSLKSRVRRTIGEDAEGREYDYVNEDDRALMKVIKYSSADSAGAECMDPDCTWVEQWLHRAGPRKQIYFDPKGVKAGILTCGGLCPGLNDVIRQIVLTLQLYGVNKISGIKYGYRGLLDQDMPEIALSREVVANINLSGGSLLGVSRGGSNVNAMVDSIEARNIDLLFILGGNGTHAGANEIHKECFRRKMKVSIVCVPKTIDNDILFVDKTFGFNTAVEKAQRPINSAYIEATSAYHGIGVVKLMGRSSGFLAMHASLASGQVDVCLIPEVPFSLEGPYGVLKHLEHLVNTKGSALVCVAEGAGQDLLEKSNLTDASGNAVLGDIGVHVQKQIKKYFKQIGMPADVKYIDPTYMIRACRANASDAILCTILGQNAVHGAFAGYSGITVGTCNNHHVYFPVSEVCASPRCVDPHSRMWHRCLTSTGQPDFPGHL